MGNRLFIVLTLLCAVAFGQGMPVQLEVKGSAWVTGQKAVIVLPGATVQFYAKVNCAALPCTSPLATYADAALTEPLALVTNLDGNLPLFYVAGAAGEYRYTVTVKGTTTGPYPATAGDPQAIHQGGNASLTTLAVGTTVIGVNGAKGDGVTNDTAALRSFFSALQTTAAAQGGAWGVIPPGRYYLPKSGATLQAIEGVGAYVLTLQNASNVTIFAYGATFIQPESDADAVVLGVYNSPNFHLYGATFDGQSVYTASTPLVFKQQLVHIINSDDFIVDSCTFRRAFGNALVATHQYSTSGSVRLSGTNAGRIIASTFDRVNTGIETDYRGVGQLEIVGNHFRNNALSQVKLSTGPGVTSAVTGYAAALTNVVIANNIVKYDANYVNPQGNTYLYGFDSASNAKQVTITGNVIDFAGYGVNGAGGIKINWDNGDLNPSSDGNQAPEKITIANNQIVNLPAASVGVMVTNTARNMLVTGNRIANAHTGIQIAAIGQAIGSWDGKSTWQISGNQFIDNDQADIITTGLNAARVAVTGNTFSLQSVASSLQALYIDSTSTIGELTVSNNESDKTLVSEAAMTVVKVAANHVKPQTGTTSFSFYAPSTAANSLMEFSGNSAIGGGNVWMSHFANAVSSHNTFIGNTHSTAALMWDNVGNLYLDRDQFISSAASCPLGVYNTTTARGMVTVPNACFAGLALSEGAMAERTDNTAGNSVYVRTGGAWVAKW